MFGNKVNQKADIRFDRSTNEVYVIGKAGKEVFRRRRTPQIVSIAHDIYMGEKYGDDYDETEEYLKGKQHGTQTHL